MINGHIAPPGVDEITFLFKCCGNIQHDEFFAFQHGAVA